MLERESTPREAIHQKIGPASGTKRQRNPGREEYGTGGGRDYVSLLPVLNCQCPWKHEAPLGTRSEGKPGKVKGSVRAYIALRTPAR